MSSFLGSKHVSFIRTVKYSCVHHNHNCSSREMFLYVFQAF